MAETNYAPNPGVIFEVHAAYSSLLFPFPGVPSGSYPEGSIGVNVSNGDFYEVQGGTWVLISTSGGGGTTVQYSDSSDPSGVPTGNARLWFRLDTGALFVYNTTTATWDKQF